MGDASRISVYCWLMFAGTMPSNSLSTVWLTKLSDFSVGMFDAHATEYGLSSSMQGGTPVHTSRPHSEPGKLPLRAPVTRSM